MASIARYRKYRPLTFQQVIGQDAIVQTLKNQVKLGEIGHAYLFTGSRGTGKTSMARIFAKAINCQNSIDGSPCGKCGSCLALSNASNLDILEIDAASNNKVDEIRELRENVKFMPTTGKYKVYIIDEVHMLTDSAFNALLKTLEEPPAHIVFILATTEVHKLPATILSRCLRFDFNLVDDNTLYNYLKKIFQDEKIKADDDAIKAIVKAGEGSVRDTLSIADCVDAYSGGDINIESVINVLGTTDRSDIMALADAVATKQIGNGLEIINKVAESGKNLPAFAKSVTTHFRDLLIAKTCAEGNDILALPKDIYETVFAQSQKFETEKLIESMRVFSSIEAELKYALCPRTLIETAFLICVSESADLKKKLIFKPTIASVQNEKVLWGKVVGELRARKEIALHIVCGDIIDVHKENNTLLASTTQTYLYELLSQRENTKVIEEVLAELGNPLKFKIEKKEGQEYIIEKDIKVLKTMFGEYFKIKE